MAPVIAVIGDLIYLAGVTFAEGALAEVLAEVFVYFAASEILNAVVGSDRPDPNVGGEGAGLTTSYAATDASIRLIVGTVRVGGMETFPPWTTGTNGEYLHKVLTLAGHQVDSFGTSSYGQVYFDDESVASASIGSITGADSDGLVSAGKFANQIWARCYAGASTETKDYIFDQALFAGTGNFIGKPFARAFFRYKWNKDVFKSVPSPTVVVNGARVYDPRLDSTNGGSGSHRYATPSTWEFVHGAETYNLQSIGSNPALSLAWYLMHVSGGEVDPADIDWATVTTAANVCDGAVSIPDGHGGSTTQDRYTCNGVLLASVNDWTDNLKPLVDAMLGALVYANGLWRMYAGSWATPTIAIAKSDWVSGLQYQFDGGRDARYNRVRVFYVDAGRNFTKFESYARSNATYQTADGGETIDLTVQQLLCLSEYESQRKGEFLLRQSRNQVMVSGRLPPRFQRLLLNDTVSVTDAVLGWSSKTFRVITIKHNVDGSLDVGLREEQDTDWTDLAYTDYNTPSLTSLPTINPTSPTAPSNLSAVPALNGAIVFNWDESVVKPYGTVYQLIRSTNSADATAQNTIIWQGDAKTVQIAIAPNLNYYYLRARANSYYSAYSPNTFGIPMAGALIGNQTSGSNIVIVGSNQTLNKEYYCPTTITPTVDGQLVINVSVDGWSTFDKDSGSYMILGIDRVADVSTSSGKFIASNSTVYYNATTAWFTAAGSGSHLADLSGVFSVSSGVAYIAGPVAFHSFGTLQINGAVMSSRLVNK